MLDNCQKRLIPYLKKANKHISTLIKIADALGVLLDELVGRKR